MDERRFDDLVRNLGATDRSRRAVLKGLLAGAVGGAVGLFSAGGAMAGNNGHGNGIGHGNGHGNSKKPDCCPVETPRLCGTQCVDFLTDSSNCGGCGNTCPDGTTCQDGACLCPAGMTLCGNSCVDTTRDNNNCGGCGTTCASTEACLSGNCVAGQECAAGEQQSCYSGPPGTEGVGTCRSGIRTCQSDGTWGPCEGEVLPQTEICNDRDDDCDGQVDEDFDLQHDVNNCGGCGNRCNSDQVCVTGLCVSSPCAESTPCLTITFNPSTGLCDEVAAPDGTVCAPDIINGDTTIHQVCQSGACTQVTVAG